MNLLFLDPVSGERVTYADLLASIQGEEIAYAPAQCPTRPAEAVFGLLRALVLGQALTLFDSDFSAEEISALGGAPELFAARERLPGLRLSDIPSMLAKARTGEGFRLTLFTSGSTGLPKQVTHRLEGLTRALRTGDKHRTSVWGLAYNPTHIAGVQVILQAFFNGNPLIHLFGHDRAQVNQALLAHGITHLSATPSFYRLLLPVETQFGHVRAVTLGGERSDPALLARLASLFPNARVRNLYASTEAGTLLVADGEVFGIAEGLTALVMVRDGRLHVHRSLLGEFGVAASPPVNRDKLIDGSTPNQSLITNNQSSLTNNPSPITNFQSPLTAAADAAAWYDTGDVVEVVSSEPLRFRILARERDWVNVGGSKVNPHEVEAALREHPAVKQVRVFGRKNSVLGSILVAEVVAAQPPPVSCDELIDGREAASPPVISDELMDNGSNPQSPFTNNQSPLTAQQLCEAQLRAWLAERLQAHKIPRWIRFVDRIEQTRTGKISRTTEDR